MLTYTNELHVNTCILPKTEEMKFRNFYSTFFIFIPKIK
jgi:hypothetical protein